MEDMYSQRLRKKALRIIKDPHHPSHKLFCMLPSGRRYRSIRTKTTSLFHPTGHKTIKHLNSVKKIINIHLFVHLQSTCLYK